MYKDRIIEKNEGFEFNLFEFPMRSRRVFYRVKIESLNENSSIKVPIMSLDIFKV